MATDVDYIPVVQQLYVSYFGRPADYYGLKNFTAQLAAISPEAPTDFNELSAAAQANPTGPIGTLVNSFNASAESVALYGTDNSQIGISKFVAAIYENVLNREADLDGLTFWVDAIMNGVLSRANAATAITQGAMANTTTQGLIDAQTVENKLAVATTFTDHLNTVSEINGFAGDAAAAAARDMLGNVDSETDPEAFVATIDSTIATISNNAEVKTSVNLTTNLDTLTGTSNIEIYNSSDATLTAADTINGAGGADVLNYTNSAAAAAIPAASITNVETFNVRAVGNAVTSTDLGLYTGLTTFNVDRSTDNVTVIGMGDGGTFGVIGNGVIDNTGDTFALGYAAAATAATLNISGGTVGTGAVTMTGTGVESTTINSTGSANVIGALGVAASSESLTINATTNLTTGAVTAAGVTALTISGAGNVSTTISGLGALEEITVSGSGTRGLGTLNAATTTVTGTGNSGAITATLGAATDMVFLGGSGNDRVTTGAVLVAAANVDGGAGTGDRLTVAASAHIDATAGAQYVNFEELALATGVTVDMDNIAGITKLRGVGTVQFDDATATQASSVTLTGSSALTLNIKDAALVGQLDTANVTVSTSNAAATISAITIADVETLNITASTGTALTTVALAHQDWSKLVLAGSADLSLTTDAAAAIINTIVDGNAATGDLTLDFALTTTNGLQVTSGSGDDTVTGTAQVDKITAGAGDDIITGGNGADLLAGGTGEDIFVSVAAATATDGSGVGIDVISDFAVADDIIRIAAANNVAGNGGTAVAGASVVVANGVATFAAADDTLAEKITTLVADAAITANEVVIFVQGSDTYVYGAGATADGTDDFMIKLTGIAATSITESTTTAGDFILA
jgi:S-layer protein